MPHSVQYYEISNDHASECNQLGIESTSFTKAQRFIDLSVQNWSRFGWVRRPKLVLSKSIRMQSCGSLLRRIEKFLHLPELEENDFKNESKSWIKIENGHFNWGDENTTLKNINLEVKPNKLVAIVGSVGSGKSSLVQVLVRND